jgi:uncharacterized protein YacL (UPF0231 family)
VPAEEVVVTDRPELRKEIRELLDKVEHVAEPISCPACGSRESVRIGGGIELATDFTFDEARKQIRLRLDHEEMREPDDGAHYYKRYCGSKCGAELPDEIMDRINDEEFREEAVR